MSHKIVMHVSYTSKLYILEYTDMAGLRVLAIFAGSRSVQMDRIPFLHGPDPALTDLSEFLHTVYEIRLLGAEEWGSNPD